MSLINQVLRDLDDRHAAAEQKALPNEVRPLPAAASRRPSAGVLAAAISLPLLATGIWLTADAGKAADPVSSTVAPAPVAPAPAEALPPPALVIAPPDSTATAADVVNAEPTTMASLRLDTRLTLSAAEPEPELKPAPAPAPAPPPATAAATVEPVPARIEKQVHVGAFEQAEAAYRKAAEAHRLGRDDEAMALLRDALHLAPAHGNARQLLLSLLVERRLWPEAEATLRAGLTLAPTHAPWAMALARIQVERGRIEQAWQTLQQYQAAGAANADYQGFAGVLLQRLRRPQAAVSYYQAALRLRPEGRWWVGLGLALEATGRPAEAHEAFVQAREAGGLTPKTAAVVARRLK